MDASEKLYNELVDNGIEVLYDDRNISAGIKFKDADLTGIPFHIVIGSKNIKRSIVEIKERSSGAKKETPLSEACTYIKKYLT
jgi:prolyl-tRNA synthetase